MTGQEILEKYPLSIVVIKDYFYRKLKESCEDSDVPEEFKEYLLASGVEDAQIVSIIDGNARLLFDVFDENELYIQITGEDSSWNWGCGNNIQNKQCSSRKEVEIQAIDSAFLALETKLKSL